MKQRAGRQAGRDGGGVETPLLAKGRAWPVPPLPIPVLGLLSYLRSELHQRVFHLGCMPDPPWTVLHVCRILLMGFLE
jgi:hypothetical protein